MRSCSQRFSVSSAVSASICVFRLSSQRHLASALPTGIRRPQVQDTSFHLRRYIFTQSRFREKPLPSAPHSRQASYTFTASAAAAALCLGVLLQKLYTKNRGSSGSILDHNSQGGDTGTFAGQDYFDMALDKPQSGYVGNLTEEQDAKLRELWAATFKIFNIATVEDHASEGPSRNGNSSTDNTDKKKSKKKLGIFNRKGESSGDSGETASTSGTNLPAGIEGMKISDADDKYGESKDFLNALANQSPEDLRSTFWNLVKHDHPDALLLRFLRARKWDVQKALIMMVSTIHWRLQEMHVDDCIVKHGEIGALKDCTSSDATTKENGDGFMAQLRLGKSFLHGADKQGRPLCFIRVRLHKQGEQSEASVEKFTVHVIETARLMLVPPVETATIVFDMTNFSLANMDYAPVKFMVKCFEANYPECLGVVLIHKAPWLFSGIWSIIKGWLDPVVAAKIQFTKTAEQLEEFIPRNHIPKDLGGDEEFTYEYIEPDPNENAQMEDTAKRDELLAVRDSIILNFHDATLSWMSAARKNDVEKCAEAKKRRGELVTQLFDAYWKLDPYLRARCLYDRQGVIKPNGKIDFYPSKERKEGKGSKEGKESNANGAVAPAEKTNLTVPEPSEDDLD